MRAYIAQIRMNLRLTFRDRTVVFFNYVFPLMFFFIFGQLMHAERGGAVFQIVNMSLSLGVLAAGLFGAGMRTVMDREQNILRRFKVAPISPGPILVGQLVTGLVHFLPITFVTIILARTVYGMPPLAHPVSLYLFVLIGLLAFRGIGSIVGAVANSMQESQIIVQLLYFPMLFLGGATFPIAVMPKWVQTLTDFVPTSYLSTGLTSILEGTDSILNQLPAVAVLLTTGIIGTFLAMKLFRWEKEEKMRSSAKLWLAVVLLPFLLAGTWHAYAKDNQAKIQILAREMDRNETQLIQNARLFLGDGNVVEQGSVLLKNGRIAEIYTGAAPDAKSLKATLIDGAGKTLLPGLIDVHAHFGSPGGFWEDVTQYQNVDEAIDRELAAYLYSGVTAVKSLGDATDSILRHRAMNHSGEKLGAELFVVGPMFTAPGGHGTEYAEYVPETMRKSFLEQLVRLPKNAEEAKQQVDALNKDGVDGIKAILEGGWPGHVIPRLDPELLRAIVAAAHADHLTVVCHTGGARDVADALNAGVDGIEHGSERDIIPSEMFAKMKQAGTAYDPTLAVFEAIGDTARGDFSPLDRSLVQQVAPPKLIEQSKHILAKSSQFDEKRKAFQNHPMTLDDANHNLMQAYQAGVLLVTGTDSGNPQMIHGPGIHRELQLWVKAGIPPAVALQAATSNAARLLRTDNRMGYIRKGYEANLLLVDGNPLQDISVTERISSVFFKGEAIRRSKLFEKE
jgi:imidazolonepropionase-like amidohydrolase/ABC-type multidrug transport system permease subunit